jgi:hypothetical protein
MWVAVMPCIAVLLGACTDSESMSTAPTTSATTSTVTTNTATSAVPTGAERWVHEHRDVMGTFRAAVAAIVESVESNDMGLFADGPQRCAESAAALASTAGTLPADERDALSAVAAACARIAGPAYMLDSDGVMAGLDPLFIALGTLTPILDAADALR